MIRGQVICSLNDFTQNASAHLSRLAENGGSELLMVNGEAKGVVMSVTEFERMCDLAQQSEVTAGIRRSIAQFEAGEGTELEEGMRAIADELGVRFKP